MLQKLRALIMGATLLFSLFGVSLFITAPAFAITNDPLSTSKIVSSPSTKSVASKKLKSSWSWYLTRASGIVASVSLVLLMLMGIGQITGGTYKILEPLTAWATHRSLGIAFGVSVVVHVFTLLFDHFIPFNVVQILVPFTSKYHPVTMGSLTLGSLWVAMGILALYLTAAVVITSLIWVDKKPHTWKLIHYVSYGIMVLAFFHALYLGTDLATGSFKFIWIVAGLAVSGYTLLRILRAGTMRK